ncbi:hypothetical protein [Ascidiimonas sp. W6]|uniref:hypothetical protein n=1 Tax=Ascidiimonas meishanensis TaxID=3128903 RepID=UPI0030ECB4D1
MKANSYFLKTTTVITIVILLFTSCINDFSGSTQPKDETIDRLNEILVDFGVTEEEKDAEGHAALYLSESSTINFVLKNYGAPNILSLTRDQWIGFFTSWDYEYFPIYSGINFVVKKGMAADSHSFQGFRDGEPDLFGNDIFVYIQTPDDWKILNLSSTVTFPDDTTNYENLGPIEEVPETVFYNFEQAFKDNNLELFESLFVSNTAPCFRFKTLFQDQYSNEKHSAAAFFETLDTSNSNLQIDFKNFKIDIEDQFTALLSAKYTIKKDGLFLEKGQILSTLVATPDQGWKISTVLFSIDKSFAVLP